MQWEDYLPTLRSPDPAGVQARRETVEMLVLPTVPVQHSPATAWNQSTPYPGPPATVQYSVDYDSARWWGRTGQGQLVWSGGVVFSADLPPAIPFDMLQHIDAWHYYQGGYPSIGRRRPTAFADMVPILNP